MKSSRMLFVCSLLISNLYSVLIYGIDVAPVRRSLFGVLFDCLDHMRVTPVVRTRVDPLGRTPTHLLLTAVGVALPTSWKSITHCAAPRRRGPRALLESRRTAPAMARSTPLVSRRTSRT